MSFEHLLNPDIQAFIKEHENDDVKALALKKTPCPTWSYALILDQIKVRQKAQKKARNLYETNSFIFPSSDVFEQASSQATATYKASLVGGDSFVDLTGGSGVDAFAMAQKFDRGSLVEQDKNSANLLKHNAQILRKEGLLKGNLLIHNEDAYHYVEKMNFVDFVFIDPQRRENGKRGILELSECSPNIQDIFPNLAKKAKILMLKTSPVLDIQKGLGVLGGAKEVHVVQWQGECKELLYVIDFARVVSDETKILAVDLDNDGSVLQSLSFRFSEEHSLDDPPYIMPQRYIYEPGPAFLKAGGFKVLAKKYSFSKLHKHTHLYTSEIRRDDFPGKVYEFLEVFPAKAKFLPVKRADLALRNFPGHINDLRKKLRIKDGGEHRIYATTLCYGEKKLLLCQKI